LGEKTFLHYISSFPYVRHSWNSGCLSICWEIETIDRPQKWWSTIPIASITARFNTICFIPKR